MEAIGHSPFGTTALVVIGIGLLGYTLWRLVAAVTDAEGEGSDATQHRHPHRAGRARSRLRNARRLRAARGGGSGGGGGSGSAGQTRHWTARLLDLPFGRALVVAVGLGVIGYAGYQLYRAAGDRVKRHLDLGEAGATASTWIVRLGRFGIGARGVVFALIGVFLVKAGVQHDSSEAGGIAQSLDALARAPFGRVALGIVALGLVAYGVFQLATARYRHIRAVG